jgi:hypothetical protein
MPGRRLARPSTAQFLHEDQPMDENDIRDRAQALGDALVAGDIDKATADFSEELRHNLGEVVALLPLPATAAAVESIEQTFSGFTALVRLTGETDEVVLQTRWKDRDGRATIIEASHLSRAELEPPVEGEAEPAAE